MSEAFPQRQPFPSDRSRTAKAACYDLALILIGNWPSDRRASVTGARGAGGATSGSRADAAHSNADRGTATGIAKDRADDRTSGRTTRGAPQRTRVTAWHGGG